MADRLDAALDWIPAWIDHQVRDQSLAVTVLSNAMDGLARGWKGRRWARWI